MWYPVVISCGPHRQKQRRRDMPSVTIAEIDERLQHLPPEKLIVVYDFVSYLLERDLAGLLMDVDMDAYTTMLAYEAVFRRDWDRPEEDAAWAHL
jgi:hypothetical protein